MITKRHQKSSRRTQLWPWSRGRSPHICSLNTARTVKKNPNQKICLHGENHSSKRRSESKSKINDQQERLNSKSESESRDKNYCQRKTQNFESESKTKNENMKAIKVRKEEALTKIKAKVTVKVNEVKAIEKTLTGPRIKRKKQLNQTIGSEPTSTLPSRFTAMFNISIFIYILTIFIFKNFISISNLIVSDLSDHPFQTFTVGELGDCKTFVYHDRQPQFRQKP
jgi:hypothetical protein